MDNSKKRLDRTHEVANELQKQEDVRNHIETVKERAYNEGYKQGIEDYARVMRNDIQNSKINNSQHEQKEN